MKERKPLKLDNKLYHNDEYTEMIRSFLDDVYGGELVVVEEINEHLPYMDNEDLERLLVTEVAKENYEAAAQIRDEINGRYDTDT